jgi:hypothetical protein
VVGGDLADLRGRDHGPAGDLQAPDDDMVGHHEGDHLLGTS